MRPQTKKEFKDTPKVKTSLTLNISTFCACLPATFVCFLVRLCASSEFQCHSLYFFRGTLPKGHCKFTDKIYEKAHRYFYISKETLHVSIVQKFVRQNVKIICFLRLNYSR